MKSCLKQSQITTQDTFDMDMIASLKMNPPKNTLENVYQTESTMFVLGEPTLRSLQKPLPPSFVAKTVSTSLTKKGPYSMIYSAKEKNTEDGCRLIEPCRPNKEILFKNSAYATYEPSQCKKSTSRTKFEITSHATYKSNGRKKCTPVSRQRASKWKKCSIAWNKSTSSVKVLSQSYLIIAKNQYVNKAFKLIYYK